MTPLSNNYFAFLPPTDAQGVQQMTLHNTRSGSSLSFSVQNGQFMQDLGIVVGPARNQWLKMVFTPTPRTPDEKAWRQAFKVQIATWTKALQNAHAKIGVAASQFHVQCRRTETRDDFATIQSYTRHWAQMLCHDTNWNKASQFLLALCQNSSSLATSKALNALQGQVKAISSLLSEHFCRVSIIYTNDPIEIYARKLLERQNGQISPQEFDWAREQYLRLKDMRDEYDPFFNQFSYLNSVREALDKVLQRQVRN